MLAKPVGQHLSALVVFSLIISCPPVLQVSVLVKLTTLIVESMTHLVSNYYADSTIVSSVVSLWIEEWWLQDSSREVDAVEEWVVESVNCLWCASHLGLVYRLMPVLAEHRSTRLLDDTDIVLDQVLAFANVNKLLHVLPLVRIAHVDIHCV